MLNQNLRVTPRLIVGAAIILLGVLFTLDNLRLVEAERFLQFWPAVFIAIGVLKFAQARHAAGHVAGAVWMMIGAWLLLDNAGLIRYRFWDFWPLILVGIGTYIVLQTVRGGGACRSEKTSDANASISALAIMGGIERKTNARNFRGGDLTAIMGGCVLDLRQASIASEGAVIDTFAFWGGIEIKVPEDWTVITEVFPLMGGIEDKTHPVKGASGPPLTIRGLAIMGGIEVSN